METRNTGQYEALLSIEPDPSAFFNSLNLDALSEGSFHSSDEIWATIIKTDCDHSGEHQAVCAAFAREHPEVIAQAEKTFVAVLNEELAGMNRHFSSCEGGYTVGMDYEDVFAHLFSNHVNDDADELDVFTKDDIIEAKMYFDGH